MRSISRLFKKNKIKKIIIFLGRVDRLLSLSLALKLKSAISRALMSEVEDLQELEKAKDEFYDSKGSEMKEFKHNVERFVSECRVRLKELKNGLNKVK